MSGNNLVYQRDINSRGEPMAQRSQNGAAFVSVVDPITGMPSIGATTTSAGVDRSVTTSTTSSQLMAANTARRGLFIVNDTAIDVWINFGATAVAAAGSGNIKIGANGGRYESGAFTPSTAINIIAASGTPAITAREFIAVSVAVADAPVIGTATAGRESASLTFTPGASNGGYTVQDYLISAYDSLTNVRFNTFTATSSPATLAPIPAGISAYFKVQARTNNGYSTQSGASNAVNILAPFAAPGAPTNVVATLNGTTITSTYTAPAINGGSAIDVYRSTLYRASNDAQVGSVTGTGSLAHTNVALGDSYYTKVDAHNVPAGYGFAVPSNIVSLASPPNASGLTLSGPTSVVVNVASSNYTVALSPTGGAVALPVTVTPTPIAGVTFVPTSLSLTTASPSGTFTATSTTVGTKSIAITNDSGLTNPVAISLVVAAGGETTNAVVSTSNFPTAGSSCPAGTGCQIPHVASAEGDITSLVFTEVRTYISDAFVATYPTGTSSADVSLRKYVEYPQGTFTPVLYGGAAPLIMGNAVRTKTSDALAITIPAGATWWEHTINASGVAIDFAAIELPATAAALGVLYNKYASAGNAPAHQVTSTASTLFFGSSLITGTIAAANVKSHSVIGDSVTFGEGDITGVGAKGSNGYIGRVFDKTGKPYVKFAKRGMSASDFVALFASANTDLDPYLALVNAAVTHLNNIYGVNDLRLARTQGQLLADYQTIYGKFPGKEVVQATLTNRTTSTDAWATTVNQTQRSDGNWGALTSVNTAIRAPQANVTTVIEASDAASTARNSNIWPAPPVPTTDGTHPNSYMAGAMAAAITYVPA